MGIDIDRTEFTAEDYLLFQAALEENLMALGNLLGDPEFGDGPASMGAELEMYIVDHRGRPLSVNDELLAEADDPQLTPELNRYNLEFNVPPFALGDAAFRQTEDAILRKLAELRNLLPFLEKTQYQSEILELVMQLVLTPFWNLRKLHGCIQLHLLSLMEHMLGLELSWAICLEQLRRLKWLGQMGHMGYTKVAMKEGFLMQMTMLGKLLPPQWCHLVVQLLQLGAWMEVFFWPIQ